MYWTSIKFGKEFNQSVDNLPQSATNIILYKNYEGSVKKLEQRKKLVIKKYN
jgi:hypothetical protein